MKYFFTLLLIAFTGLAFQAEAQNTTTCNPAFTSQHLNGMTVKFNPVTTDSPMVQHYWYFAGSGPYYQVSPSYTFSLPGVQHVKHVVIRHNPNGVVVCADSTIADVIAEGPCNLTADFSTQTGTSPLTVYFAPNITPSVQNSDSIVWTFGDGTSSTGFYPVHTYTSPGTYTVCLRVKLNNTAPGAQPCTTTICKQVTVSACNFQVYFSHIADSANNALIHFTNQTPAYAAGDSILWTFGDGTTSSQNNPNHVYANPGTYNVCLIIRKYIAGLTTPCVREYCKVVTVLPPACTLVAEFTYSHDSTGTSINNYHFTNTSVPLAATDSIRWTFGDGTSSNQVNPNHVYTQSGTYTVCLRVIKRNANGTLTNCISEVCHQVVVTLPTTCTLVASFTISHDSTGVSLNNYHFTNTSTPLASTDSIRWSFGDGTFSNQVSPNHVYTQSGTYNVCLVIIKRNPNGVLTNCIREVCHTVVVTLPTTCTLVASFTASHDSTGTAVNYWHFTNTSTPLAATDSIRWTFGDGTSSNQVSPNHYYTQPGTYVVCLRIIKRNPNGVLTNCISEVCHTIIVTLPTTPCTLVASFTVSHDSTGVNVNNYHFTNTSAPLAATDSIRWSFGDGTFSNQVSPNHVYAQSGTYTVCLLIIKRNANGMLTNCASDVCHTVTVVLPNTCNLTVGFTSYRDSAAANLYTYHFINLSTPLAASDSIRWTFGDGTSSNQVNPVHAYAQPGTYTVCLRVIKRNPNGVLTTCIRDTCKVLVITQICNIQPHYTWHVDSLNYKKIYFTNTTISPVTNVTAIWYFGDGTTATSWNAVHEYAQAGTYNVCLRIASGNCVSYYCDSIRITVPVPPCTQLSNYHFTRSTADSQTYYFAPDYVGSGIQYTWTFGDGTGTQPGPNATHHFATAGNYTVCLTAFKNSNCASTTCKTIQVHAQPNCSNSTIDYNYHRDSLVPNRVTFMAYSNAVIIDQVWTITKQPATAGTGTATIHLNNPTYVFIDTGYYRVCLRATLANGCIKEYCNYIYINQLMPGTSSCTLQAYPNPAGAEVHVSLSLAQPLMIYAYIYNSANVLMLQKQQQGIVGNNVIGLNTANLPAGIYTIRVVYGNAICSTSFVKQ